MLASFKIVPKPWMVPLRTWFVLLGLLLVPGTAAQAQTPIVVNVGATPRGVVIDTAANRALVTNFSEATISVVDLGTERVTATIDNIPSPMGIALHRVSGLAVVANQL